MKKSLFLLTAFVLLSCGNKDKKTQQIEESVTENAMGNDLNYKPISTEKIVEVTYQDIVDVFYAQFKTKPIEVWIKDLRESKEKNRKEGDHVGYNFMNYYLNRFLDYQKQKDKNAIAYTVYKHTYSIKNPLLEDAHIRVTNYYFFDNEEKLIANISEDEFKSIKRKQIKHKKAPYEAMLYGYAVVNQ